MYQYTSKGYQFIEPDDDEPDRPDGHCRGTGQHGCGRFTKAGAYLCDRCRAEWDEQAQLDADEEKRIALAIADEQAYWDAYWKSPEGLAEIAEQERQSVEFAQFAEYTGPVVLVRSDDDDLPF